MLRSPLLGLRFWRVVLDEAQMAESSTANAAALARRIARVHAWGVTGTPIGRDRLDDLYGLLLFLGGESGSGAGRGAEQPWAQRGYWRWGLKRGYEAAMTAAAWRAV